MISQAVKDHYSPFSVIIEPLPGSRFQRTICVGCLGPSAFDSIFALVTSPVNITTNNEL